VRPDDQRPGIPCLLGISPEPARTGLIGPQAIALQLLPLRAGQVPPRRQFDAPAAHFNLVNDAQRQALYRAVVRRADDKSLRIGMPEQYLTSRLCAVNQRDDTHPSLNRRRRCGQKSCGEQKTKNLFHIDVTSEVFPPGEGGGENSIKTALGLRSIVVRIAVTVTGFLWVSPDLERIGGVRHQFFRQPLDMPVHEQAVQ
jgi:hypothetical protein